MGFLADAAAPHLSSGLLVAADAVDLLADTAVLHLPSGLLVAADAVDILAVAGDSETGQNRISQKERFYI